MDDGKLLVVSRYCLMRVTGVLSQSDCYRRLVQIWACAVMVQRFSVEPRIFICYRLKKNE
jgi:hypothetical protein